MPDPILRLTDALRNAMADRISAAVDAGAGLGTIKLYSGTQPLDADDSLSSNTLLATLTFSDPSAPAASGGVLTFSAITPDALVDATDEVTWARVEDSDGNNVLDVNVTVTGGGGLVEINTVNLVAGGSVSVTNFTLTVPVG